MNSQSIELRLFFSQQAHQILLTANENQPAKWGLMNLMQMTEHLADFFRLSIGEITFNLAVNESDIPKYTAFLFSDKPFKENTKAPLSVMPEVPHPVKHKQYLDAVNDLHLAIHQFFQFFAANENKQTLHPVFGMLNFQGWLQLHYKHVTHHLRQFGLM